MGWRKGGRGREEGRWRKVGRGREVGSLGKVAGAEGKGLDVWLLGWGRWVEEGEGCVIAVGLLAFYYRK